MRLRGRSRFAWSAVAVVVAVGAGFSGSAGVAGAAPSADDAPSLTWSDCGGGAQCAHLKVPLDYAHPGGASVELAVLRVPARDPARRIGSLVVNPGGPGGPGLDYAHTIGLGAPAELRDRFDIVGFDPRGTGESSPVRCGDERELDAYLTSDFSPTTNRGRAKLIAAARAYSRACKRSNGPLLAHVSTLETAQDLDRLRAALGDAKLTYLGFSYGTYLGAVYADRYPTHVRALALDGAVDPALSFSDMVVQQSVAFEQDLQHFFDDCTAQRTCTFPNGGEPGHAYDELRARIARAPLVVGSRTLTATLFDTGVFALLYGGQAAWPQIDRGLADAQAGNGTALLAAADDYNGRAPDGSYVPLVDPYYAIQCLDGPAIASPSARVSAFWKVHARAVKAAPRLGGNNSGTYAPCATTLGPVRPARLPTAKHAPPILIVNTTNDPATPLPGAKALSHELRSAVLVTEPGYGHALIGGLTPCIADVGVRYLVDLQVPPKGTTCPGP